MHRLKTAYRFIEFYECGNPPTCNKNCFLQDDNATCSPCIGGHQCNRSGLTRDMLSNLACPAGTYANYPEEQEYAESHGQPDPDSKCYPCDPGLCSTKESIACVPYHEIPDSQKKISKCIPPSSRPPQPTPTPRPRPTPTPRPTPSRPCNTTNPKNAQPAQVTSQNIVSDAYCPNDTYETTATCHVDPNNDRCNLIPSWRGYVDNECIQKCCTGTTWSRLPSDPACKND